MLLLRPIPAKNQRATRSSTTKQYRHSSAKPSAICTNNSNPLALPRV